MNFTATVTKQGQISIPVKIRRQLNLDQVKKALVWEEDGKIIVEPIKDLLDLRGSLKTKIKASPRQIREAFGEYLAEHAVKRSK